LPFFGAIVPFAKDSATGCDFRIVIATVIDYGVNTTTFLLPGFYGFSVGTAFTTGVRRLERMPGWVEGSETEGVFGFTEEFYKVLGLCEVELRG
jgi:hypothetical protein